jgi:ribonuclease P/MRP protein subunit POP5
MKHLPKHLQPRWRYLAVGLEAWPDAAIGRRSFQTALWAAARSLLGDLGSADADLRVLRFDFGDGMGAAVVRVRRGEVARGRAALACVDAVDNQPVGLVVRGVSGTVRACEEKYLSGRQQAIAERTVAFDGAERSAVVRGPRLDVAGDDGFTGATHLDFEYR